MDTLHAITQRLTLAQLTAELEERSRPTNKTKQNLSLLWSDKENNLARGLLNFKRPKAQQSAPLLFPSFFRTHTPASVIFDSKSHFHFIVHRNKVCSIPSN